MAFFGLWRVKLIAGLVLIQLAVQTSATNAGQSLLRQKRVIGGSLVTNASESSWMVSLQGRDVTQRFLGIPIEYGTRYCGGTLIHESWVLTAAHCFKGHDVKEIPASKWHARVASPNLRAGPYEQVASFIGRLLQLENRVRAAIHIDRIVIHPGYASADSWRNDIALVKLRDRLPTNNLQRIAEFMTLPGSDVEHRSWPSDGQVCRAYGWGCTRSGQQVTSQIMKVELEKTNNFQCSLQWQIASDSRVCAGGIRGQGRGVCQGDSGGPLVCARPDGRPVQAGIISFVHSEEPENHPVVFTRVSHYTDWIRSVTRS